MENVRQFENLTATQLYCRKCKEQMPVRERLLLVLPGKELFDYACKRCGESLGQREVTAGRSNLTTPARGAPGRGHLRLR